MSRGTRRFALLVVLGFLALGAASAAAIRWGLGSMRDEIRAAPGFAAAWARAATSPGLRAALGAPELADFSPMAFVRGRQRWRFDSATSETAESTGHGVRTVRSEHNDIEVPIRGPHGTGTLSISADEHAGIWKVQRLDARLDGRAAPLDLLAP